MVSSSVVKLVQMPEQVMGHITRLSSRIQKELKGKKPLVLRIQHPLQPDPNYPVFSKSLIIVKNTLSELIVDPDDEDGNPDLVDLLESCLPWIGVVTFNTASRQFRNKNRLAVSQEVVMRFGNQLYSVKDAVVFQAAKGLDDSLCVYSIRWDVKQITTESSIIIEEMDLDPPEVQALTNHDMPLSPELLEFMEFHGFQFEEKRGHIHTFTAPDVGDVPTRLTVVRYGALVELQ